MIKNLNKKQINDICFVINESAKKFKPVAKSYHEPFVTKKDIDEEFQRLTFFGYFDDKIVGVSGLQVVEKDVALVRNLYILPDYQGKGIGTKLLKNLETKAKKKGIKLLLVGTYSKAYWAVDFYMKHGFKKTTQSQGKLADYWGHIPELHRRESVVLEKWI